MAKIGIPAARTLGGPPRSQSTRASPAERLGLGRQTGGLSANVISARVRPEVRDPLRRYREFLALPNPPRGLTLGEGATPLIRSRLSRLFGGLGIDLKLECRNPGGGVADRGAAAVAAFASRAGFRTLLTLDGGLAGPLARYAARVGLECTYLCSVEARFDAGPQVMGGPVRCLAVEASADQLADLLDGAERLFGSYVVDRGTAAYLEGVKTLALELAEETADGVPDAIVLPASWGAEAPAVRQGMAQWVEAGQGAGGVVPRVALASSVYGQSYPLSGGRAGRPLGAEREASAARRLAAEEDGLQLGPSAGRTLAAAIKLGRSETSRVARRVVAVVERESVEIGRPLVARVVRSLAELGEELGRHGVIGPRSP